MSQLTDTDSFRRNSLTYVRRKETAGGRQEVQPRVLYKARCTIAVLTALLWQERKGSRTGARRIRLSFGNRGPGSPGAKGPASTRESRNTHPLEPHGHVLLTERDADRLAFVESFQSSNGAVACSCGCRVLGLVIIALNALLLD